MLRKFPMGLAHALAAMLAVLFALVLAPFARASTLGQVQGVVHDPGHRPIAAGHIVLRAVRSDLSFSATTGADGAFSLQAVPPGVYSITVSSQGFADLQQTVTVTSSGAEILHFQLEVAAVSQTAEVHSESDMANVDSVTPETMISRTDIETTPGADRTNSLAMVTDYTPGAYMTHDMLHMRGGHELNWMIDGVPIPNTNIASNVAAQIDPRDIDTLEIDRGSPQTGRIVGWSLAAICSIVLIVAFGVPLVAGGSLAVRAISQVGGRTLRIDAATFVGEAESLPAFRRLVQRYIQALFGQISQAAACNRLHSNEERLSRWLLMMQDRAHADTFGVTQEFLSFMLGVRRVGISGAAAALQQNNLIEYSRGRVTVLNRKGLEAASCSCYADDRRVYTRIMH